MRKLLSGLIASGLLVGCGVFGAADPPDPPPAPGTPQDNAQPPPVDGSPIPGVYVSTSLGNDEGSGTAARPLKTLKKAFALANEQHLRVIACAEVYEESLTLIDGVSAYGYYECAVTPWKRGERRAIVKAPSSPAVLAKGLKLPTRLEGFEVRAPDLDGTPATDDAGSSIALEVHDSLQLVISGSQLHGGKASPGGDGAAGPANSVTAPGDAPPGRDQNVSSCNPMVTLCSARTVVGGPGAVTTCAIGAAGGPGGQGGDGRFYIGTNPNTVAAEFRGRPLAANASTAIGGLRSGYVGLSGSPGAAGADGTDGANGSWSLGIKGFVRGNGTGGEAGQPGQGGGGGAGTDSWFVNGFAASNNPPPAYWETATGGGGGSGGCAGQAGTPATGGGASIGALVVASSVSFEGTRVEAAAGGRAGLGNLGGKGTFGNTRGAGVLSGGKSITGDGGNGGPGGNGGASGHGAPGPSIALAYSGTRPVLTATELAPGPGGGGQPELRGITPLGVNKTLPAAAPGESKPEHEIK